MTYANASDFQQGIREWATKKWPHDNQQSRIPKLTHSLNALLRSSGCRFSERRVRSLFSGEISASIKAWEAAAITELLKGATDEEKALFGEIEKLSAEIERQGQIIESLKKQMDGQSS